MIHALVEAERNTRSVTVSRIGRLRSSLCKCYTGLIMNPIISGDKSQVVFSTVLFIIILALALLVFLPFLNVIALSIVMAVLLTPVYKQILKHVRWSSVASALTILLLLAVIIVPLFFITNNIISEAQGLYANVENTSALTSDQLTTWIEGKVQVYVPDFQLDARGYVSAFSQWTVSKLSGIFSETVNFVFKLALSFVALFYLLRDGNKLYNQLVDLTPWSKERDDKIFGGIKTAIKSVVSGSLSVALIQGILVGIGFTISGVPNATLWGTLAAICALIPGVGTAIVWVPATIFLFATDPSSWQWIFQLIYSVLIVSSVDNFVGPMIMQRGINIHPMLILFSVLGGIQFFGPEGFLLGPLVLSILFVLIRTLKTGPDNPDTSSKLDAISAGNK